MVKLGRNMIIVAFSCITLLSFAVNFAKYHQIKKPKNNLKNEQDKGPKGVQKGLKNRVKRTPKRPQNDPGSSQKWSKITLFLSHFGPKTAQKLGKNGLQGYWAAPGLDPTEFSC